MCVGPTEPSGHVTVKANYNYHMYNPINAIYWDNGFHANLAQQSNVSYAHLPLAGKRRKQEWRNSMNAQFAVIGNRGPEYGSLDEDVYGKSITLDIHGTRKQWIGNTCYNDGHVTTHNTFYPEGVDYADDTGQMHPDNLFKNQTGDSDKSAKGWDIWLVLAWAVTGSGPEADNVSLFLSWD